jgi:hypothetical protein
MAATVAACLNYAPRMCIVGMCLPPKGALQLEQPAHASSKVTLANNFESSVDNTAHQASLMTLRSGDMIQYNSTATHIGTRASLF